MPDNNDVQAQARVKIPEVAIKLHWPHFICEPCDAECVGNEMDGYKCVKCGVVYEGRTEYVKGLVHKL